MVLLLQTHKSHISTFATSRERCERATAELLAASPRAASPAKESQYLGADAWRPKTSNNKQNMWHSKHHLNVFYMFNPLWDRNILYPEPQSNNRNIRNIYIYISQCECFYPCVWINCESRQAKLSQSLSRNHVRDFGSLLAHQHHHVFPPLLGRM